MQVHSARRARERDLRTQACGSARRRVQRRVPTPRAAQRANAACRTLSAAPHEPVALSVSRAFRRAQSACGECCRPPCATRTDWAHSQRRSGLVCFETALHWFEPRCLDYYGWSIACADPDFVHGILRFLRRGVHARTRDGPCATCDVQPKYIVQHAPQPPASVLLHTLVTDRACTRALALWRTVRRCHETVGECSRVSCFSHQCATLVSQAWRRRLILRHSTPSRCCSCRTHTSPTICAWCVRQAS